MKRINTYNLIMKGLRKASGETQSYRDAASYDEIFYDRETGEVWTRFQHSLGFNSWTEYHNPAVVKICNTRRHMTMQAISDAIHNTLQEMAMMAADM